MSADQGQKEVAVEDLFVHSPFRPSMLWAYRLYRPSHLRAAIAARGRSAAPRSDDEHLRAAAGWLERAQDVGGDGGVAGRYRLGSGWSASYPETTGYIVPTFIALAPIVGDQFEERAARCVRFLLSVQLESGAFPAGEIDVNRTRPSAFNSAQIVHGLLHWHLHSGDAQALEGARRAADWLVEVQDPDGAWRQHVYGAQPATHLAHLACWLAEIGTRCGEPRYLDAAGRHLDWLMGHRDPDSGWFDRCDFDEEDHAARVGTTHVVGYTLAGLLALGEMLGREDALAAARDAGARLADSLERHGWIGGVLDHAWRPRAASACLTGNAQLALFCLALDRLAPDPRLLETAVRAIDLVERAQVFQPAAPDLHGAVPGSSPVWGSYIRGGFPNWAAKFLIDALLAKRDALARRARPGG